MKLYSYVSHKSDKTGVTDNSRAIYMTIRIFTVTRRWIFWKRETERTAEVFRNPFSDWWRWLSNGKCVADDRGLHDLLNGFLTAAQAREKYDENATEKNLMYREHPPTGQLPRWFYWSPAHWRRWQVQLFEAVVAGFLMHRCVVGCTRPAPAPIATRTWHGKTGWGLVADSQTELAITAGRLCPNGWRTLVREPGWMGADEYIIECDAPKKKGL